jgi:hypothetical protein
MCRDITFMVNLLPLAKKKCLIAWQQSLQQLHVFL